MDLLFGLTALDILPSCIGNRNTSMEKNTVPLSLCFEFSLIWNTDLHQNTTHYFLHKTRSSSHISLLVNDVRIHAASISTSQIGNPGAVPCQPPPPPPPLSCSLCHSSLPQSNLSSNPADSNTDMFTGCIHHLHPTTAVLGKTWIISY